MSGTGDISGLIEKARLGQEDAQAKLLEAVQGELRQERLDHTLQPSALVHEAYLRLFPNQQLAWNDRAHFLCCAARAMRQILTDHARRRNRVKRYGALNRVPLDSRAASDSAFVGCHPLDVRRREWK